VSRAAVAAPARWRLWRIGAARTAAASAWHTARVGLVALVVLAPLPFAGQHPLAWSGLGILVGLLLLLWTLSAGLERERISRLTPKLWPLAALFAVVPLWALLVQAGTWTPRDWHSPLWQLARTALADVDGRITIDPHATGTATMRLLTYGAVFWLAFQYGRTAGFARGLVKALAVAGLAYAAWGLAMHAAGIERVLWVEKPCCIGDVTSTFINRNHYAPYAGLGLLCALGLLLTTLPREGGAAGGGRPGRRRRPAAVLASSWWRVAAVGLPAVAVVLTHSRGGLIATVLGVTTLLLTLGATGTVRRRTMRVAAVLILLAGAATVHLVGERTVSRFEDLIGALEIGETEAGGLRAGELRRFDIYERAARALADAPLTGTGFGTFADSFRWYQGDVPGFVDYAHNTYLEAGVELGLPVATALLAAVGGAVVLCVRGLGRRRRDRLYPALAVAAAMLVGSHALIDFAIQIPAVAITFAALLGVGCAQAFGRDGGAPRPPAPPALRDGAPGGA